MAKLPTNEEVRSFWDTNPVAAEGLAAIPGSEAFYRAFDATREADDCEPYAYSDRIHGYETPAGKLVLDVGCGNGYVLSRYARHGAEVHGVDLTPKAVELSRRRFELDGLPGTFEVINGVQLPFPDDHFDIVCSMGVLHHIADPRPTIAEIYRVMKPGGTLILMLYYRWSYKYVVLFRLKRLLDPRYKGKSQQQALNMNDGADCPLAMVYSKREAADLLKNFERLTFRLNQLSWRQLFLVDGLTRLAVQYLPLQSDNWLARMLGWNLYIECYKPARQA